MNRCIQLAKNGLGTTYPNPMVGCVIVYKDTIIGEGWHRKSGESHAEVRAIASVKNQDLLKEATLYVSLEPCSHYGKTPPCSDLIIEKGIPEIVVGSLDPNPLVAGKGLEKLRKAGCRVTQGILEEACDELNKRFFTFHKLKRPYIVLKWAETQDGFMAPATQENQQPYWISDSYSRQLTHKYRATEQAILIGHQTVLADNPSLTTRSWHGSSPLRLVIARDGLETNFKLFHDGNPTLVFQALYDDKRDGYQSVAIDFKSDIARQICDYLYSNGIQSLLVEGGCRTLQTFIDSGLFDDILVFVGTKRFESGLPSPTFKASLKERLSIGSDTLLVYKNNTQ